MLTTKPTKSETLEKLRTRLKHSTVLPQVCFTLQEWLARRDKCVRAISERFAPETAKVIIRSSSKTEDSETESQAGHFRSVLNVPAGDLKEIEKAVQAVILSYGPSPEKSQQVFAQPMVEEVRMSGVVFTRDLDALSPYYIINYDDHSHRTDSVTAGTTNRLKTRVLFRGAETQDDRFKNLLHAVREIESVMESDCLDIEFAVGKDNLIYLFQVRPLVNQKGVLPAVSELEHYLQKIEKKIEKINRPHPYVHGDYTLLGVMPDWNPAEMIGIKPRPLALSLYRELITARTWAYQRDNYGYKNLRSYPLLLTFIGHPYIDSRVSFNSFIPKPVPEELSRKLTNYYLHALKERPQSHDKVEFDIIFSCYCLGMDQKLSVLKQHGFAEAELQEIKAALRGLTNSIISGEKNVFRKDLEKIEELKARQKKVLESSLTDLEKIYWLIEDCNRWGTLPFAGLARAGFIAVQMLHSFIEKDLLSQNQFDHFMSSLNTVAKQMALDKNSLSRDLFLKRYGHLRPGTYDILSDRYDSAYARYFGEESPKAAAPVHEPFKASETLLKDLDAKLLQEGLQISGKDLLAFIKEAIEGREYAKFIFTKSVSEVLELIKKLGARFGISSEDLSYIDIKSLLHLYSVLDHRDLEEILTEEISRNKEHYKITKWIRLPPLITSLRDIFEFELDEGTPNFVTLGRIQAEVISETTLLKTDLTGKIVCIKSADPGYDWLFTKGIAGLVTAYGGANSHMAIRAAELMIPAIIGAGETSFARWSKAKILEIDAENKQVKVIR